MNYKTLAIISSAVIFLFTQAASANSAPEKCPGVEAINAAVDSLFILPDAPPHGPAGYWFGYQNDNFDTQEKWGFGIADIKAKTKNEAFEKIKYSLNSLSLTAGPVVDKLGCSVCEYKSSDGHSAQAMTPIDKCK